MSGEKALMLISIVIGVMTILGLVVAVLRWIHRRMTKLMAMHRSFERMEAAFFGDDDDPGMQARIASIEKQLQPNDGKSTRDLLDRIEAKIDQALEGAQ